MAKKNKINNFPKRYKYNVAPKELRTLDGIVFDSVAEMRRYKELKILEQIGEIKDLKLQPRFLIVPKNADERAVHYVADFQYTEEDKEIVEDVKGAKTRDYIIKRKLFKWQYPNYVFKEIKAYRR